MFYVPFVLLALSVPTFYGSSQLAQLTTVYNDNPWYGIFALQLATVGVFLFVLSLLTGMGFIIVADNDFIREENEKTYYDENNISSQFESTQILLDPDKSYYNPLLDSSDEEYMNEL